MVGEYKLAVVVRDDLELSRGKMSVQVAHAAVSCSMQAGRKRKKWFNAWLEEGQRKVVVRAKDLGELRSLEAKARSLGLTTELVTDAGLTEVPPGTTTCLGVGPGPEDLVDRITGQLRLV